MIDRFDFEHFNDAWMFDIEEDVLTEEELDCEFDRLTEEELEIEFNKMFGKIKE